MSPPVAGAAAIAAAKVRRRPVGEIEQAESAKQQSNRGNTDRKPTNYASFDGFADLKTAREDSVGDSAEHRGAENGCFAIDGSRL